MLEPEAVELGIGSVKVGSGVGVGDGDSDGDGESDGLGLGSIEVEAIFPEVVSEVKVAPVPEELSGVVELMELSVSGWYDE